MMRLLRLLFPPMIYERVNEPIEVLAAFHKDGTKPMTFKWGNRCYQVKKVDLVHTEHDGREKIYYFCVSSDAMAYRLSFRSESLRWMLEEICEAT